MAAKWNLVCLTCLAALPLGRLVTIDDTGVPGDAHWEGFRNKWDGRSVRGNELSHAVGRFLALHLGHELATVETDAILHALEPFRLDAEPLKWIENVEDLLEEDVPQAPDVLETDAAVELSRRLQSLGR